MIHRTRRTVFRRLFRLLRPGGTTRRFTVIGFFIVILIICSAFLVWYLEAIRTGTPHLIKSFADGIWWAIVTVTTVGYGDLVPVTPAGRIVGAALILIGFSLFSLFTGLIASLMVEEKLKGARGLKPIKERGHMVLCGWNDTALIMLQAFAEKDVDENVVLVGNFASDFFNELEAKFPSLKLLFVRGDYALKEILQRAGLTNASQVIVLADHNLPQHSADDRAVIVANAVRYISKTVPLTVQLVNRESRSHLENVGVDNIVIFEEIGGNLLANNVINHHYVSVVENLLRSRDNDIETLRIPPAFIDKPFSELVTWFYAERGALVLGILSERPRLEIADIFTDDSSTIDAFIKSALQQSRGKLPEQRFTVLIKPPRDYRIQPNDSALVLT